MKFPRLTVDRPKWLMIIGPDLSNADYGVTINRGPIKPLGEWRRWRSEWRINIRWPIQIKRHVVKRRAVG